jgi:hypothetical protein
LRFLFSHFISIVDLSFGFDVFFDKRHFPQKLDDVVLTSSGAYLVRDGCGVRKPWKVIALI